VTSTLLSVDRYFEVLESDTELLASTLEPLNLDAPVDACPGWSLADLGYHVGDVARFWNWIVSTGATSLDGEPEFLRPPDSQLAAWIRAGVRELVVTLRAADPAMSTWFWKADQGTVADIRRRYPHEMSLHRWDAEQATSQRTLVSEPSSIAPDVASDGISELFYFHSTHPVRGTLPPGTRVALHATDTHHSWACWLDDENLLRAEMVDVLVPAAATIRGRGHDLLLALWRRVSLDDHAFQVNGDLDTARAFVALAELD
jgi:uncharacterized protein (TIGR03083 family)